MSSVRNIPDYFPSKLSHLLSLRSVVCFCLFVCLFCFVFLGPLGANKIVSLEGRFVMKKKKVLENVQNGDFFPLPAESREELPLIFTVKN